MSNSTSTSALEQETVFKTGSIVPESGIYVCVPCGYKKYFVRGQHFSSCIGCLESEEEFVPGFELWEKLSQ